MGICARARAVLITQFANRLGPTFFIVPVRVSGPQENHHIGLNWYRLTLLFTALHGRYNYFQLVCDNT